MDDKSREDEKRVEAEPVDGGGRRAVLDRSLIDATVGNDLIGMRDALGRGARATAVDEGGFTALMWAARYDLPAAAQELMPSSDLDQLDSLGRAALAIAREGAGPESRSARIIEAYQLAQEELAALTGSSGRALKSRPRRYRL